MKQFIILVAVFAIGSTTARSQTITLKAKITDIDTMMVLVRGLNWCDTILTNNGNVNYRKKIKHPEMLNLIFVKNAQSINAIKNGNERMMRSKEDGKRREVFLAGGSVELASSFAEIPGAVMQIEKQKEQNLYLEFRKRFDPLVRVARTIIDSSAGLSKTKEGQIFQMLYDRVVAIEQQVAYEFVKENTESAVAAYILYRYCRIESAHKLDSLYQLFNNILQNTAYLENVKGKIVSLKALVPGKPVPQFRVIDNLGHLIDVKNFLGKYVVLDFWGSWCRPCIDGFPMMKDYQSKFKEQCVFIGIACNDEYNNWQQALKDNSPEWPQIMNPSGEHDIARKYNVEAYPTKIIIDSKGAFVKAFVGESKDFYKYLDSLFVK